GNSQMDLHDKGVIDIGCSRHMTRNMSYLIDYEEINRGYVAFGGNPKGGKITGKCTIRTGSRLDWLFDIDVLTRTMNYESIAAGTQSNGFTDQSKGSECKDQEQEDNVNNTNNVNAGSTNKVNAVGENISSELPFDLDMPALEDISTFNFSSDHEDDDELAGMNNLDTTIQVSTAPTTRVHKDHPLDQVIKDLQSATQTRIMTKNLEEHRFVSTIRKEQTIKTFKTACLLAFYHKKNPKDNSCIERFKLDRRYAGRASTIQVTRSLDFSGFTKWKKGY
nr:ribonuclease H-like domain-containing protein [Tanacetum cinerariifolium]